MDIVLIVLAVLLAVWVILSVVGFKMANVRPKSTEPNLKKMTEKQILRIKVRERNNRHLYDSLPEDLSITDDEGYELKAWFVPSKEQSKRFVICVHGYKCNGPDEFSMMLPFYHDTLGYNYLLPDHRSHGRSEGKYIGFASFEPHNLLLWVKYLTDRFGDDIEIILHGISMGAATVMRANELNPPKQVKLIIEDCGYTSAKDIIVNTLAGYIKLRLPPVFYGMSLICRLFFHFNMNEADCLKNMPKAKRPILFIHGGADTFVPTEMGIKLHEACKSVPKDLMIVDGAVHAFSYYDAREAYEKKVTEFIDKHMGAPVAAHKN